MEISIEYRELFEKALAAAPRAYAPYSRFGAGPAREPAVGSVFPRANVENRSFGLTTCAERGAVFAAVSAGYRTFGAIAIATPDSDYPVSPCGACRQVLSEFMPPETPVLFGPDADNLVPSSVGQLFPFDALHELAGDQQR